MPSPVVTRFAPSPTGFLHIGGARTALFNWLYARRWEGRFLLRIEDTDRARSTAEATAAILRGLDWLGLDYDDAPLYQSRRAARHAEVAHQLLAAGKAYRCFATPDEIAAQRKHAQQRGGSLAFRSPWRDSDPKTHPDRPFAIRIKAPTMGDTLLNDAVQGVVRIANAQLDDMTLLRSDGTPVYMLAVVVDDHDMGITHVIRGDDHLNNAARQMMVYEAMGWPAPVWAHIPLIHGADGKKLSKRHGALAVDDYQAKGYPAAGLRNYLARLGWSHGDAEFFTDAQARNWFDLGSVGKSPARLDMKKLAHLCGRHMAASPDTALLNELRAWLAITQSPPLNDTQKQALGSALYCLKSRARCFPELLEKAAFVLSTRPIQADTEAAKALSIENRHRLRRLTKPLQNVRWAHGEIESALHSFAQAEKARFGEIASPLRAALAGRAATPGVIDMLLVLGRRESLARIEDAAE